MKRDIVIGPSPAINRNEDLVYKVALSMIRGMTVPLAQALLELAGSERELFTMTDRKLQTLIQQPDMRSLGEKVRREALERAERECGFVYSNGIRCLYFTDDDYPRRLLQCEDAPVMLYMLGSCDLNVSWIAGIVGTRHATSYGLDFTTTLVKDIREKLASPVTIVSGLAYGIDIAAHQESLKQGLPTVGIVAHGLDMIYPVQHRSVAARMVNTNGGIVTEYPSGTKVHRGNFLARNRIIAGLTDCLIVSESAEKGGALVTARLAGEYDREVFALPGRTSDKYSVGCNNLIATSRAHLADGSERIFDHMGWTRKKPQGTQEELFPVYTPEEEKIIEYLRRNDSVTTNRLSIDLGLQMGRLLSLMIEMEFKGLVIKLPGARYRLR